MKRWRARAVLGGRVFEWRSRTGSVAANSEPVEACCIIGAAARMVCGARIVDESIWKVGAVRGVRECDTSRTQQEELSVLLRRRLAAPDDGTLIRDST